MLDFSKLGGSLLHAMFDRLKFPTLKEVILNNVHNGEPKLFQLSKYLQSTLESLKLVDSSQHEECNWLTIPFLTDVAERCPGLKEVSFWAPDTFIEPTHLAKFFQAIRPRHVLRTYRSEASLHQCT